MIRSFVMSAMIALISISALASDSTMPPKNPKAQATTPPAPNPTGEYGEVKFTSIEAKALAENLNEGDVIIKATVGEVCPKKGCWMNVNAKSSAEPIRVTFKDYGFFVPVDLKGKEIAMKGRLIKHIESVEEQKHLLKDAKRPQSEIDAIVKPKETLRFVASGVKDLSVKN